MGGLFGGGSNTQTTTQAQTTQDTSTTNAQQTYNFTLTNSGLTSAEANQVSGNQNIANALAGINTGAGGTGDGSALIYIAVIIVLAAIIFRGGHG